MKNAGIVMLAVISAIAIAIAIGLASYYGGIFGNHVQANYQKRVVTSQVQQKVRTAVFAQGAYEKFFNLCAATQTDEASLDAQYTLLAQATSPDDKSRIQTNIGGLIAARADSVNEYNADAAEYTHGQFHDAQLPARLDNTYTKGVKTTCAR